MVRKLETIIKVDVKAQEELFQLMLQVKQSIIEAIYTREDPSPLGAAEAVMFFVAAAWDEGFNAGQQDVMRHQATGDWDSECIRNPYKET